MLVLELDGTLGELVLRRFPSAGVDAWGRFSRRRVLFEELVAGGEVDVASGDEEVPLP